jgi:hypothetical protein
MSRLGTKGLNILDVLIWKFIRGFMYVEGDMAKENLPCPMMWHQKDWWTRPGNQNTTQKRLLGF